MSQKGYTEDQTIELLEKEGYDFFEGGHFDKNLFLTIASDNFEYDEQKQLWFERED